MSNRIRVLKIAGLMAFIGPFPGYVVFAFRNFSADTNAAEFLRLFSYFYGAALLVSGWYCFLVGLAGVLLHDKLGALGLPRLARTGALVLLGAASAVPAMLIEGAAAKGVGLAGSISAAFWIAAYLILAYRESRRAALLP